MSVRSKIIDLRNAREQVAEWQANGQKVVFTNGCFDIIHKGHLDLLEYCQSLGDRLVIGVNADSSVQRLKGPERPIKNEQSRAHLLAALSFTDLVIIFAEDTPLQLIEQLQPDVLVKGGDYSVEQIIGADIVLATGGVVKIFPLVSGESSTTYIDKLGKSK